MAEKSIYEQIKKQNGETFAKAIRTYDNGIFDIPNIVHIVKYAGRDANPILPYLESLKDVKVEQTDEKPQDPVELLDKAGYNAYYADTLEKQNRIEKYFEPQERLCTFNDNTRFQRYYIINAVKKNVDEIKRKDFFGKEEREDEYGRSVISIQIAKEGGFISIKNRYNHTVEHPDNTFYSNPDEIIKGLSVALKNHFKVDFSSQETKLADNFIMVKDQIVRYNYEKATVFYGSHFYVVMNDIIELNKDKEIMLDTWTLNINDRTLSDTRERTIMIDNPSQGKNYVHCDTGFGLILANELKDKKLKIVKNKNGGHDVLADGIPLVTSEDGKITALTLPTTEKIGHEFLSPSECPNKSLKIFNAPNLKTVGYGFLCYNKALKFFNAPKLKNVGYNFLCCNKALESLSLPSLERAEFYFLINNQILQFFDAPKLKSVGEYFLYDNRKIQNLYLPSLESVENNFLECNNALQTFYAPNLKRTGYNFLKNNNTLLNLSFPKLESVGCCFLEENETLQFLDAPNLNNIQFIRYGRTSSYFSFLCKNKIYETNAPAVEKEKDKYSELRTMLILKKLSEEKKNRFINNPIIIGIKSLYYKALER